MSIRYLNWALELELSANDGKAVLIALANYADEAGTCYPSQDRLARNTGLTERTVRRHIERLQELGYLTLQTRRDGQRRATNRYCLPPLPDTVSSSESQPDTVSSRDSQPDNDDISTGHPVILNRTSVHPEPDTVSSKPPVNHQRTIREPAAARAREADPDVEMTVSILSGADWIDDDDNRIREQLARSFELVPMFSRADGPLEAEKFVRWFSGSGRKKRKSPDDWYRAWLNWIKRSLNDSHVSPNGRSRIREPDFSGIDAFDEQMSALEQRR